MPKFTDFISFATSPVWNATQGPLSGPPLSQSPNIPTAILYAGDASVRVFGYQVDDLLCGGLTLPAEYKEGTDLTLEVHWSPVNASTDNVRWTLRYFWVNVNAAPGAALSVVGPDQPGAGVAWTNQMQTLTNISGAGKLINSIFTFELLRDTAAAPSMTGRVCLHSIAIYYQIDAIGSRQVAAK